MRHFDGSDYNNKCRYGLRKYHDLVAGVQEAIEAEEALKNSVVYLTESEYQALVDAGEVDPEKTYCTYADE